MVIEDVKLVLVVQPEGFLPKLENFTTFLRLNDPNLQKTLKEIKIFIKLTKHLAT